MKGAKHEHIVGRYVVRTEWRNNVLYYDVLKSGQLVAVGFDMLSRDEETALVRIIDHIFGTDKQRYVA